MKSTISDLRRDDMISEKAKELRGNLEGHYNILWNKLDDDSKQILCNLRDCHAELTLIENEDSFIQGFSLAVKLMTEALAH